ncbi:MAG: Holliday junction branch migration protein RuvA [Candidatus Kaelpia aquatica]|nr:Holliday junction branch migration protein RuvA [Candidatus Kaelpia aquatica]
MISRLKGAIRDIRESSIVVSSGAFGYEILIPDSVLQGLERGQEIDLVIYSYYQNEGNKMIPVLIGFRNYVEREFFENLIKISGIGAKVAIKALKYPASQLAVAIDKGDEKFLSSLPGIGQQKARLIIAKLQGKVGKYALVQEGVRKLLKVDSGIRDEALDVLLQLQYKKSEAEEMIDKAFIRNSEPKNVEELLNEIYRVRITDR